MMTRFAVTIAIALFNLANAPAAHAFGDRIALNGTSLTGIRPPSVTLTRCCQAFAGEHASAD